MPQCRPGPNLESYCATRQTSESTVDQRLWFQLSMYRCLSFRAKAHQLCYNCHHRVPTCFRRASYCPVCHCIEILKFHFSRLRHQGCSAIYHEHNWSKGTITVLGTHRHSVTRNSQGCSSKESLFRRIWAPIPSRYEKISGLEGCCFTWLAPSPFRSVSTLDTN